MRLVSGSDGWVRERKLNDATTLPYGLCLGIVDFLN